MKLPPKIKWPADNYNHLHEQPTQFYAIGLALVLAGAGDERLVNRLAWAYVGLRVIHSLIQSTFNNLGLRFFVFIASSLVLLAMGGRAAYIVF